MRCFDVLHRQVPEVHARFDLVPDGTIDEQDINRLVHDLLQREFGDVDLDGDIDFTDIRTIVVRFDPLIENLQNGWAWGDVDGDGDIDIDDISVAQSNYQPMQPLNLGNAVRSREVVSSDVIVGVIDDVRSSRRRIAPLDPR